MDEFTDPPAIVRPAISNFERAGQLVQEAQTHDNAMRSHIGITAEEMVLRGTALNKAMQLAGKGKLKEVLSAFWKGPTISTTTARRYMKQATEQARRTMVDTFESHTHRQLDGNEEEQESSDDETPPLTVQERKVLISLIGTVKPGLAKKLRDGTKILSDTELHKEVPPSCGKCQRFGPPPKPCEACARVRSEAKLSLFDAEQEPEDEDDPASGPKPPPNPYLAVAKEVTKVARDLTKLAAEDKPLYDALVACRLMDHSKDTPSFCALAGVKKVIEMVEAGETLAAIKRAYDLASGAFVPPRFNKGGRNG